VYERYYIPGSARPFFQAGFATFKKQRQAPTATESKEYPGRCHFPGQDGWEEVADFVLSWATEHSNRAVPRPA